MAALGALRKNVISFGHGDRTAGFSRYRSLMGQGRRLDMSEVDADGVSAFSTCSSGTWWGQLGAERLGWSRSRRD